jgi:hypothetical protein
MLIALTPVAQQIEQSKNIAVLLIPDLPEAVCASTLTESVASCTSVSGSLADKPAMKYTLGGHAPGAAILLSSLHRQE